MKRLSMALCVLALAAFASTSALADTFTFNFSGPVFSGYGHFTADQVVGTSNLYNITSVFDGWVDSGLGPVSITGLLGVNQFGGNDNILVYPGTDIGMERFFDSDGVSFSLENGIDINLSDWIYEYAFAGVPDGSPVMELDFVDVSKQSDPPAVPEPGSLALLGTGLLGLTGIVRRRFAVQGDSD